MAKGTMYVVFVVPVVFTVLFSSAVLAGALDELDREIKLWPPGPSSHDAYISISGLEREYLESGEVQFRLDAGGLPPGCGTVDVQVRDDSGNPVGDYLYEDRCHAGGSFGEFSVSPGRPGSHTITVVLDLDGEQLLASAIFQVR